MPLRSLFCKPSLLLTAALALAGCASDPIDVSTTFDPLTPFPAQATYLWDDAANQLPDDPRINQMEIDSLIREAANTEFAARGYRLSTAGSAHYKLSYDLAIHTWYAANNTSSLGSLSLWLTDAATRRRVWMGYVRAEILVGLSREERLTRLEKAMARLLEKFPPAQRGGA
jgi:hypothetical protein